MNNKAYSIIIFLTLFLSVNIFPNEIATVQKELNCKHRYLVFDQDSTKKYINFEEYEFIDQRKIKPVYLITKTYNSYLPEFNFPISLVQLDRSNSLDTAPMLVLIFHDSCGLYFTLTKHNNTDAFNTLVQALPAISLQTEQEVLTYLDWYLRLSSNLFLGWYRVNKPSDIWTYPQFYEYVVRTAFKDDTVLLSKDVDLLMVENIDNAQKAIQYHPNEFQNFVEYKEYLRNTIVPIQISQNGNVWNINSFVSNGYNGDLERFFFTFTKNGKIVRLLREKMADSVGVRGLPYWGMQSPDNQYPNYD